MILTLVVFVSLISGCTEPKIETKNLTGGIPKLIEVYVDEDPQDPNNVKEIHIADVTISDRGELGLIVIKDVPDIERLKSAIKEIESKEGLFLEYEERGGDTFYLKSELIRPGDPRYAYALEGEFAYYGFIAETK